MRIITTVDLFSGGGGSSTGMEVALRRRGIWHRGVAINHCETAIETMSANHRDIDARCMSIESARPSVLVPGRRVELMWASPTCTHFSRALGGRPRNDQLRSQPEFVTYWLDELFVDSFIVENVPEFLNWGLLDEKGKPIKEKAGSCFKAWINDIRSRDYDVDWRIVNCADFGDATTRRRFFLKAVRRGYGKIVWPNPTHAKDPYASLFTTNLKKWRGIRECLDMSDLGTSIFERKKPLARKTLDRIMVGLKKFNGLDFQLDIVGCGEGHEGRVLSLDSPMRTQHAGGNRTMIVRPFIVKLRNHSTVEDIDMPCSTVTTSGGCHMLCQPIVIGHTRGGKAMDGSIPIGAQTTHDRFSMVTPLVLGQHGGSVCRPVDFPCPTIATSGAVRGVFPVLDDGRLIDIRIRMLKPSELASAHSFPKDYILKGNRTEQVRLIGNSVPVMTAAAMCESSLEGIGL